MSGKSIKTSLSLRVFCLTFAMLLASSGVTYAILSMVTPITYISIVTDQLENQTLELAVALEGVRLEDSGDILDEFIVSTGANVAISNMDGKVVKTSSHYGITASYEEDEMIISVSPSAEYDTLTVYPNNFS